MEKYIFKRYWLLLFVVVFTTLYFPTSYCMNMPNNIVPLVTPRNHGAVDSESLAKLVEFQINNQVTAFFLLGTTGEFNKMSLADKKALIDGFYKIKFKAPVFSLIGISAKRPDEMLELIKYCNDKKYALDAFVIAPMFGEGDPEAKINLVLQHTKKPIMLYDNPAIHNDKALPLALIKKFAANPQIIGIKDSSGNKVYFHSLLQFANNKFHVYQGIQDDLINDLKDSRVSGCVSGTTNIIPQVFYNLAEGIDREAAQKKVQATKIQLDEYPNYIAGIKAMLHKQGILASLETFD